MCDRLIFTCGHCGASHDLEELKRGLYVGERSLGDLQAGERGGPLGLGRRMVRRRVTRAFMRGLWRNLWTPLHAKRLNILFFSGRMAAGPATGMVNTEKH